MDEQVLPVTMPVQPNMGINFGFEQLQSLLPLYFDNMQPNMNPNMMAQPPPLYDGAIYNQPEFIQNNHHNFYNQHDRPPGL